ncbi:MAG: 3-isopropylmalate dehydratase small subunit [Planctomycetota bacterium]
MEPITQIVGRALVLHAPDIDTDRIVPARFLTRPREAGFGDALFADWALYPRDHGCNVLVAGRNFGCGSSREHAVWALRDAGFRAVLAPQFADIFRSNALKNGLLAIECECDTAAAFVADDEFTIDLDAQTITRRGHAPIAFRIDPFARHCLLRGIDELDYLIAHSGVTTAGRFA